MKIIISRFPGIRNGKIVTFFTKTAFFDRFGMDFPRIFGILPDGFRLRRIFKGYADEIGFSAEKGWNIWHFSAGKNLNQRFLKPLDKRLSDRYNNIVNG